jgi:hypothetical protein
LTGKEIHEKGQTFLAQYLLAKPTLRMGLEWPIMIIVGVLHEQSQHIEGLVTTGVYSRIRHPSFASLFGIDGVDDDQGRGVPVAEVRSSIPAVHFTAWLFLKPGRVQNWLTKLYLSIAFAWNGIVFFLLLAQDITGDSYGNYLFASMFVIVSVFFAVDLFRHKMQFSLPAAGWRRYATLAQVCYFGADAIGVVLPFVRCRLRTPFHEPHHSWYLSVSHDSSRLAYLDDRSAAG